MNKFAQQLLIGQAFVVAMFSERLDTVAKRRDERGVVSIEYIVLGAAIIFIVGILSTSTEVQDALKSAFTNLFNSAG